jgi:DNA-damage-inducible protein J
MITRSTVQVRIDENIKKPAEILLKQLGIKPSQAINMFYRQIIINEGIPFNITLSKMPNIETSQVIKDVEQNKNLQEYNNFEDAFKGLKI